MNLLIRNLTCNLEPASNALARVFSRQLIPGVLIVFASVYSGSAVSSFTTEDRIEQVTEEVRKKVIDPIAGIFDKLSSRFNQRLFLLELDKVVVETIPRKKDRKLLDSLLPVYQENGFDQVEGILLGLQDRNPASPVPMLMLSMFALKEENSANALSFIDKALVLDESLAFSSYWKTHVLISIGQLEDAKQAFVLLKNKYPRASQTRYIQALLDWHSDQREQAMAGLQSLIKNFPNDVAAYYALSSMNYEQREYRAAIDLLNTILPSEFDQSWGDAYLFKIRLLGNLDRRKGAQAYYENIFRDIDKSRYKSLGQVLVAYIKRSRVELASVAMQIQADHPHNEEFEWIAFYIYLEIQDHQKASILLARLADVTEDKARIYSLWGHIAIQQEQYQKAVDWLNKAIEVAPNTVEYYRVLASIYDSSGQYELAIKSYRDALFRFPNDYSLHQQLGKILRYMKRHSLAVEEYKKAIEIDAKRISALIGLGHTYASSKDWEKAEFYYKSVIATWPATYEAYWGMALVNLGREDNKSAEVWARRAIASDSGRASAYRILATAQYARGKPMLAKATCELMREKIVIDSEGLIVIALCYYSIKEYDLALLVYKESLEKHQTASALNGIAHIYFLTGEYEKSIQFLEKGIADNPRDIVLLQDAGIAYGRLGKFNKVLEFIERIESLDPDRYETARWLGHVLEVLGLISRSREALSKAMALAPDNSEPFFLAGEFESRQEQYNVAIDRFLEALRRDDRQAEYYTALAVAYYNVGQIEKSIEYVDIGISKGVDSASTLIQMGSLYNSVRRNTDAVSLFSRAADLEMVTSDLQFKIDYGLGKAYLNLGESEKSVLHLNQALNSKAERSALDNSSIHNLLGQVFVGQGFLDKGLISFKRAAELQSASAVPLNSVGYTYFKKKEYDTAVSWYEKALAAPEQFGGTGLTLYNIALAYYMKGDRERARKYQKQAKSQGYPGSPKFEAALR